MNKKDLDGIPALKAAASGPDGHCVAFAALGDGTIAVFNTNDGQHAPVLQFTPCEWEAFLDGVRTDRFITA
ncbi:DUF397 domain-containing protein [Nocardia terpenica]|uniref:DUF397 domain-containing protein n=1 Tax=Nocardia terpenica TaxID=455432 RepID=A0A164P8J8_9NOCA|nr:DUF397 domain-containing protein [Nocardia terpenica]KZM75256.1 hypothetical protein AWN90_17760 [Nocardia terpenica]MBF6063610.1 DUF397 domain-containing protein [Nocardia terpenica]MBF6109381.1 DUF397 domain-containing protein [Nocardia terpenica]MBF6114159.1 DUF397 domain-containing protein [Nocardia terpenica]MBF6123829.1 DUF397 domain-containing protein [Nocardia terpenica]